LKQEKYGVLAKLRAMQEIVAAQESEKVGLQAKLQVEKSQLHREKEKLLAKRAMVKEVVSKACHSMSILSQVEKDSFEAKVVKLTKIIHQL